ncbi:hypothetical protein EYF80_023901 [Liparis tanakae]|uniref:Uncharacterized protein n=1 Tax=Liparis tanakae TaxID=230148 RepID=A0A4Z2HJX5_9TELE|nr:hypothetical protein EYF80_023901 [Liparis tanakae]
MESLETSRVEEWAESQQGSGTADENQPDQMRTIARPDENQPDQIRTIAKSDENQPDQMRTSQTR